MEFHYTVQSNKTIEAVIESLDAQLKEEQFGILWQLDLTQKLRDKGIEDYTRPFHILEVCNPHEAAKVLSHNELVGYFLPCKIVVYADQSHVHIGLPRPSALIGFLNSTQLTQIAEDIEQTLIRVIEKAK
ncbi:DUF302 domain-containing protein [Brevibacillus choshinensis]|uniref:DUF302 domain-containing protein n=1 Tax=Brevibacillus choshinensis TaxID=54911 RepID=A0ABX7FXD7_BRECH|nr:DUF302 domain-containing protein [Brevibacillus choshinensis]QRG70469.1 DUF302 domain-containing protein [Brevibacillus choshinensis]